MKPSLSIIIPAYNEQARLPETLRRIFEYLHAKRQENTEVLVVDDGSSDGTVAAAERFNAQHENLRVLRNPGNRGKGYAVRHGMLEAEGEWRLFTDADLSAPIEELDKLYCAVQRTGAEVAIGSRAVDRSLIEVHQSAFRETAGKFFNVVMQATLGLPFADTQCGFKLFAGEAAQRIFSLQRMERFGFDAEVLFIAGQLGYKIEEVPVRWRHVEGTKISLASGADSFADLARVRLNHLRGFYNPKN